MIFLNKEISLSQFFVKRDARNTFIALYFLSVVVPAGLAVLALYMDARLVLEKHLFSSHIKISNTGEIFRTLMIRANVVSVFIIVVLIMILSLYVFRRLNSHFHRMEERFDAIGRGDFSLPAQQLSRFNEISTLINLSEQIRQDYRQRFTNLDGLLEKLDKMLTDGAPEAELRRVADELTVQLRHIHLPEATETKQI